jgi:hypothetical protein
VQIQRPQLRSHRVPTFSSIRCVSRTLVHQLKSAASPPN